MVVDPFGDETARLIDRGFGMMDAVERGAGLECGHVIRTDLAQLAIRGDDGSFASAADLAFLLHRWAHS